MRLSPLPGAAALLCLAAGPALPQSSSPLPIATVTCGDIAGVPAAYQAALIFYAAGYRDGLDYAHASTSTSATAPGALPTSPTVASQAAPSALDASSGASSKAETTPGGSKIVGGLVLQTQDVIAACASAPQAFLTDIIVNHGGARGPQGSPSGTIPAAPPQGGGAPASENGVAPPASAAPATSQPAPATTDSGPGAVSADLGAATQQLQQNLTPSVAPGAATPAPGAQPTPGATTPGATTSP